MTNNSSDDERNQNIVLVRVPIHAWAVAAVVVALFHFKAVGENPPDFYQNLRWLTLPVTVFGLYVALEHYYFGWMFLLGTIAVLYNPAFPFHLSRSSWFVLNIASGTALIASALLLRWNTDNRWLIRARDTIDKSLEVAVFTVWTGLLLHVAIVIALLPITYLVSGDEGLIDDWNKFLGAHLWLVGIATVAVVWLYYWWSSPETIRRFLTEHRTRSVRRS